MTRIFCAVWLVLGIAAAEAQTALAQTAPVTLPCRSDRILNTNGIQISLRSGQAYQAYPGTGIKMGSWLPLDKVTVCRIGGSAVEITNLDRKNQVIKALRIYPANIGSI